MLQVAFGPVARELVVYRHWPLTCATQGEVPADWLPPNAQSFNRCNQPKLLILLLQSFPPGVQGHACSRHRDTGQRLCAGTSKHSCCQSCLRGALLGRISSRTVLSCSHSFTRLLISRQKKQHVNVCVWVLLSLYVH